MVPTPQQFFNAYFGTPPYPATMVWTGLSEYFTPAQEAQWLNELLAICDSYPNIQIWMIAFINISGNSIEGAQFAPPAPWVDTGVSFARSGILTAFTIAASAGLAPNTTYTLQLLDQPGTSLIADITQFTTDSIGAWSGTAALPNTTAAQANAGGVVAVEGTHVGKGIGWTQDQTADFTTIMQGIAGHTSFLGALYEVEYFGNTAAEQETFQNIVNGAGYYDIAGGSGAGSVGIYYSEYPYYSGQLVTGTNPANNLGVHYGETGTPPAGSAPIWTQAVVMNIINNSVPAPITIIIAYNDTDNPAGQAAPAYQDSSGTDWYLYMSPVLRGWIADDPDYQNNFLQSGGSGSAPMPTMLTLTVKAL
jgi:hypothetical protein